MTEEEREARIGLACLHLEAPPKVCQDVQERVEVWVAAAQRAVRAEDAALVRAAGCLCRPLDRAGVFEGKFGGSIIYTQPGGGGMEDLRFVETHDPRCPEAIAADIERGGNP